MSEEQHSWREDFTPIRIAGFVAALILSLVLLPFAQADDPTTQAVTTQVTARKIAKDVRGALAELKQEPTPIHVTVQGPEHLAEVVKKELQHGSLKVVEAGKPAAADVIATVELQDPEVKLAFEVRSEAWKEAKRFESASRIGTWPAVLPPLVAILLALFFRRLLIALFAAIWLGGTMMSGWNPAVGIWKGVSGYIVGSVSDTFNLYIIGFTLLLVGMVQVINRMGGIAGVLEAFSGFTATARSTRVTTALLGVAVFFDDYANTVVVGTSMRPVTDRRHISREKLAYLVDSMSAPIAGIAIISTWVGYEVGLFGEIAQQLGLDRSGYDIFFSIIPLRFYCLFTIVFVLANALLSRDFGPMLIAERRAAGGEVLREGSRPLTSAAFSATLPLEGVPHRWWNGVIPITWVLVSTLLGMFWSGWSADGASIPPLFEPGVLDGWSTAAPDLFKWEAWRSAFSGADGAKVLFWSAAGGAALAILLAISQRLLSVKETLVTFGKALPAMWLAITILVLAWSIRAVCDDVGTSIYLVGAVRDVLAPSLLPIVTFILAAVVAFATGTSWGTMGILLPAMVPLAFYMTEGSPDGPMILLLCFGAVLDGAIFGDHCSPISDTTVMSSISASCDHLDHVRTQLPYALATMLVAGVFGYVGVAVGLPVVMALIGGAAAVVAVLWTIGKPIDDAKNEKAP